MSEPSKISWNDIEKEILSAKLSRKFINAEKLTLARLELKKGLVVPEHQHENEQISWVLEGKLQFDINGKTVFLEAEEVLIIPPDIPHKVTAIEDTLSIEAFSPARRDWDSGEDQYLRE